MKIFPAKAMDSFWLRWIPGYHYLSSQSASPIQEYSINVMWINKDKDPNSETIFPSTAETNLEEKFLDMIIQWARYHPSALIHVWFDSALNSPEALKRTQNHAARAGAASSITYKDIRTLKMVQENPDLFITDIPVYFRTDLLRAIAAYETLEQNKGSCFVYADLDVKPLSYATLFDHKTTSLLHRYHYVMAQENNTLGFENSVQIFTFDQTFLEALKTIIIDANLLRGKNFIADINEKKEPKSIFHNPYIWKIHEIGFQENVFYSYPLMHAYLHCPRALTLPGCHQPYDIKRDGVSVLQETAKILMAKSSALAHIMQYPIPTKQVSIPESTSAFKELRFKRESY